MQNTVKAGIVQLVQRREAGWTAEESGLDPGEHQASFLPKPYKRLFPW
jgi:hypothetical protein